MRERAEVAVALEAALVWVPRKDGYWIRAEMLGV